MKGKKKRKFQDFHEYTKNQNNNTFSKEDKDNDKENKTKKKYEFKSSLDNLIFYFPNFSSDFIKDIFEDNDKNYSRTKEILKKLSEEELENNKNEENQNKINLNDNKDKNINNNIIEEKKLNENNKDNIKNNNKDITHLAQFEIVDKDDNIEELNKKKEDNENIYVIDDQKDNDNSDNKINDYNYLLDKKDKYKNEYYSMFNGETNDNNNSCNNNYSTKDDIIIDENLFDQNIEFLCECFPEYTREQIVECICNFDFDIDAVVLNILNEKCSNFEQTEDDFANLDITDKDEILSNFLGFENGKQNDFDYELFQDNLIQKDILDSIKKENNKKQNKINEDDYYNENEDNQNQININNKKEENEEYFLNKNIDDIKTPKIKEDLKKLIKHFPLEDEFKIKLLYYQYMNYQMVYKHLSDKDDIKNIGLKSLLNSKDYKSYSKNSEIKKYNNKSKKKANKYDISDEKRQYEIFKKIIDKKPINWKLEEDKTCNLNDYMAVRKRLIIEAKNAYATQKYKNGQILMAKAKRYKQEYDKIYKNHKIQQFAQNNENRNNNEIDLHHLNVKESKYIINRKIKLLKEKKIENNLKTISLAIITGKGDHSNNYQPVLFPSLLDWLKNRDKLSVWGDISKGTIFVTIY